jgi:ABC-type phosphate transport system substrate-binding protein
LYLGGSSFDAPLVEAATTLYDTEGTGQNPGWLGTSTAYKSENSEWGRAIATGDFTLAQSLKSLQPPSGYAGGEGIIGFSDIPLGYDTNDSLDAALYQGSQTVANFSEIPVALGGVGIIYNLGNATGNTDPFTGADAATCQTKLTASGLILTGAELSNIFDGTTTSWNNTAIEASNPKLSVSTGGKSKKVTTQCLANLTNENVSVYARTAGSGTSYLFSQYLHVVAPTNADWPTSVWPSASDITLEGNSGALAPAVAGQPGGIGYVEQSYAIANTLPTAKLYNASNKVVALTPGTVAQDAAHALAKIGAGFGTGALADFNLTNAGGKKSYPISGVSWAVVQNSQSDGPQAIAIAKFLEFLTHTDGTSGGQSVAVANGYVPLPKALQAYAQTAIAGITYGGSAHTVALTTTD